MTDWETAMGRIVGQARTLLEERGPSVFAHDTGGQLFVEEYYTLAII